MNIDIFNIGHYRITDFGRKAGNLGQYQLFNREADRVYDITEKQFRSIKEHMSVAACAFVEKTRQQVITA